MTFFGRRSQKRKQVILLRPKDHRGEELKVNRETDVGVQCDRHEGVVYRIFKHGPAWSFPRLDRFLAIEGEPMTSYVTEDDEKTEATVPAFLRLAWGDDAYDRLPSSLRDPLMGTENHKWAATVTVEPSELDEALGLDKLKAAAILKEHNIGMFEDFAHAEPKKDKLKTLVTQLMPVLLGFFIGVVVNTKGWF